MPHRFTAVSRSTPPPKNKPKQSQSPNAIRDTQHAIRKSNPIKPKQTQFQNGQNKHKYSNEKGLCQRTTNNEQRTLFKTKPIQTQFPPPTIRFFAQKRTSPDCFLRRSCGRSYHKISHPGRSALCTAGTAWSLPPLPRNCRRTSNPLLPSCCTCGI